MKGEEIKVMKPGDEYYPSLLKNIPGAPKQLFVRGSMEDTYQGIAIVGTRKATIAGLKLAEEFAEAFGRAGFAIVSGLAMGIDTAAHKGALKAGAKTIAVLGCGIDKIFPAQNENLAKEILKSGGAIISEYPAGAILEKRSFLERNRIVSGLSIATIVIEAPVKSGALRTAGDAAEQGRPVFVIPGPVSNPNYAGSHALIRDGATLATTPEEIMADLGLGEIINSRKEAARLLENPSETAIIEMLNEAGAPMSADELSETGGIPANELAQVLAVLTINKRVIETPQGYELA